MKHRLNNPEQFPCFDTWADQWDEDAALLGHHAHCPVPAAFEPALGRVFAIEKSGATYSTNDLDYWTFDALGKLNLARDRATNELARRSKNNTKKYGSIEEALASGDF